MARKVYLPFYGKYDGSIENARRLCYRCHLFATAATSNFFSFAVVRFCGACYSNFLQQ